MPRSARTSPEEDAWLMEQGPRHHSVQMLLRSFVERFGRDPGYTAFWNTVRSLGVELDELPPASRTAERRICWRDEPAMHAWMLEHDTCQPINELVHDFRQEFGFGLSFGQVSTWRRKNGRKKNTHTRGYRYVPIGSTRQHEFGYVMRKYHEGYDPDDTHEGWEFVHVHNWEAVNGPVPEGCNLVFVDGDRSNCDPSNLVPVERRLLISVNRIGWHDRDSLELAVAMAKLRRATFQAEEAAKAERKRRRGKDA